MNEATQSKPKIRERRIGLPSVARAAHFARYPGPAVLVTTEERLSLFSDLDLFGVSCSTNPNLSDWPDRNEKVVISLKHAMASFPDEPDSFVMSLEQGREYPRQDLIDKLLSFGYERDSAPGFTVQGDTVLVFINEDVEDFFRLEFFGNELENISRGEKAFSALDVTPKVGLNIQEEWTNKLIEHLEGVIFLDAPELYPGALGVKQSLWLWEYLANREVISFGRDSIDLVEVVDDVISLNHYRGQLSDFDRDVRSWTEGGFSVSILLKFERSGAYLRKKVLSQVESKWMNQVNRHPGVVGMVLASGPQEGGYKNLVSKAVLITEELLYGYQGGRRLKRLSGKRVQDASQLSVGDFLIHPDHGVGSFLGLEPRKVVGIVRDYLNLQYAGEGRLYLPVDQLPLLRRHPGTTDNPPRLSTLGTNEWARAKERARLSAQLLASELIKVYAKRQISDGISYPPLPEWDPLIEEGFPFTLTRDQESAISSTFEDMERSVPMDRLISGDVGFGKTEVALRAAHRALGHGKQVAMLVPTTVLARQHYEIIRDRFKVLPVRVAMLARFTPDKESKEVEKGMKDGSIDLVVGTHRLLARDVVFKDLGLLIIDEEHRFGVGQKERLRSLRDNLDVLSLSATPIPRTLYMSLVGLRDVSQILTAPEGRQPIQTVLQPYDALAVREAVLAEIERGGKVFYIHDRIGSIGLRARTLSQLIPEARIGVAHGQMDIHSLEEVMLAFEDGAYDVLLSTTIVESGLDINGANTLVIERADRLGLAQLYQLRGRVGRRETEAWAYLFYPGRLTEQAQRRLYAIAELDDLGSGHLLAERDMAIRGVGNLLGPEQHGHVNTVSIVVYSELVAEEVAKLKGEKRPEKPPVVGLHVEVDARIPATYISDDNERITSYGRLAETDSLVKVNQITKDLRQRYGPFPPEVKAFLDLVKLRLLASGKGVVNIEEHPTDIQMSFVLDQKDIDFDSRKLRDLPYSVEPTKYPPGFSLKKRGLAPEKFPQALMEILYLCG